VQSASQLVATLEVAGLACGLRCDDPAFSGLLVHRYAGFLTARAPDFSVEVVVRRAASGDGHDGGPYARVGGDASRITVGGADFDGAFDEERQTGHIVQPPDASPLETLLTAIYAARLLREGGCLLHAAAILRDGVAYVFYGPSGSGKSTVAELVGEGIVSDEITVLRPAGTGWTVSGMPWRGTRLTGPLGAFFRLHQSRTTEFRPLAPARAVRSLLPCAFFVRPHGREIQAFLDAAAAMVSRRAAWEMRFRPDREFWAAMPLAVAA
jgi:hypothetical protein